MDGWMNLRAKLIGCGGPQQEELLQTQPITYYNQIGLQLILFYC